MTTPLPENESDSRPWTREDEESYEGGLRLLAKLIAGAIRRAQQQQAQAASELPPKNAAA